MAYGLLRNLKLWLLLFLSWLVLCVSPVIQDIEITSEVLSTEKLSNVVIQQKVTPHLVSLSQTETIITDNIDVTSLIITPSIAPATPLEDIKVLHSVASVINNKETQEHGSSEEHSQKDEEIHHSTVLNEEIQVENKTEQVKTKNDEGNIEELHDDDDDFQVEGSNVNNQNTVQSGGVDDGEKSSEGDHDDVSQTKDNVDDKEDSVKEDLKSFEEGSIDPGKSIPGEVTPGDKDPLQDVSGGDSQVDVELAGTHDDPEGPREDMPSFKEWSEKFLAQKEQKNKEQLMIEKGNAETHTQVKKSDRKQNNYASVDCGANILEKNSEAQNAESILVENKDFYMLNPCSANIWFIVELCDHVQVTSLQLANFELFSSTIEKFQVSFSTRYPSRDWEQLQTFTAISDKAVQTFKLEPIFAKYMKVEQLSYHGSEHYCPWSLLRVYGNSMVEEYEEHESSQDGGPAVDDNQDGASSKVEEDKNVSGGIIKSATDAVLNFVKETAKKLVKTESSGNTSSADVNLTNSTNATGSPEQPSETPKAIVQLMDREDFEASCVTDEVLTCEKCSQAESQLCSPEGPSASFQVFFELVYNVCRAHFKNYKVCCNNSSKNIALNKSTAVRTLDSYPKSKEVALDKGEKVGENEMVNNGSEVKDGSSADEEYLEKDKELTTKTTEKTIDSTLDNIVASQSSSTLSETKMNENPEVVPAILPSTSSSISVATNTAIPDNIQHPSSPTPLAQPPLALNQLPDTEEPCTEPSLTKEHKVINEDPEVTSNELISDLTHPPEITVAHNDDHSSTTTRVSVNLVSMVTISSHAASVNPDKFISADTQASVEDSLILGPGENVMMVDSMKAISEDKHIDVLKITLTDEETKEGTAELEPVTPIDVSERSGNEKNETLSDVTMNDTDVASEPTSKVDSGSSSLKDKAKTLDIVNDGESKENDVSGNEHKKEAFVETMNEMKSENEDIETQQEDDTMERIRQSDITRDISSKMDEKTAITEHDEKDSESNSEKCDAKEYEVETAAGPTISAGNGQTNSKKESIFVAMSRKIKALEQKVTMTNLFLDELSQRYRKSLEDMQKKMEKKLSVMSQNSNFLTQVNLHQNTTILALNSTLHKVEKKLNEATLRLKVVNQEVVERHVLGMCIQFLVVLLLWYVGRNRARSLPDIKVEPLKQSLIINRKDKVGNGHTKHSSVEDIQSDTMKNCFEDFTLSKSPSCESTAEGKRRRRRRTRPSSVTSDHFLEHEDNQDQNIVTKTAGLLFHTTGYHEENVRSFVKDATQRPCSVDNVDDSKDCKKSTISPKTKKVGFRHSVKNEKGVSKVRSELFRSDFTKLDVTKDVYGYKGLTRSKSAEGSFVGNEVNLYNNDLISPIGRKTSSRCSLQSDSCDQIHNQKSRWIWGFG